MIESRIEDQLAFFDLRVGWGNMYDDNGGGGDGMRGKYIVIGLGAKLWR